MSSDRLVISMDGLNYQATFYLSGVKVATLCTNDLQLILKECEQKTRMMYGLAKGKVLTTIDSKH